MSVLEDIRGLINKETQKPQEYNALVKVVFDKIHCKNSFGIKFELSVL